MVQLDIRVFEITAPFGRTVNGAGQFVRCLRVNSNYDCNTAVVRSGAAVVVVLLYNNSRSTVAVNNPSLL